MLRAMKKPGILLMVEKSRENAYVWEIAISLGVIKSVAHHKFVRNTETYVISLKPFFPPRRLIEERSDPQVFRLVTEQEFLQIGGR